MRECRPPQPSTRRRRAAHTASPAAAMAQEVGSGQGNTVNADNPNKRAGSSGGAVNTTAGGVPEAYPPSKQPIVAASRQLEEPGFHLSEELPGR